MAKGFWDMREELDLLVAEYTGFEWTRLTGAHEFKGVLRRDKGVEVSIRRSEMGWVAAASIERKDCGIESCDRDSPCEAMADLLEIGLVELLILRASGAVDTKPALDTLGTQLTAMTRERDDIQQHAWQVEQERDALRAQLDEACDAKIALVAQDGARLRAALEQETARADRWQECAADLMAQVARLRAKVARQSQLLNGSSSTAGVRDAEG